MKWFRGLVWIAILGLAGVRAGAFLRAAWLERTSPLETVYLEAGMTERCIRVATGAPLYLDWTKPPYLPNFFTPGYFLLVGNLGSQSWADPNQWSVLGRTISLAALLVATIATSGVAARRFGLKGAVFAGLFSIGSAPVLGFGFANRPDLLADSLGLLGLLASIGRNAFLWPVGAILLAAAAFAKQTAVVYVVAAAAACLAPIDQAGLKRRWLHASVLIVSSGCIFAIAGLMYASTSGQQRFWSDIVGERLLPWSFEQWLKVAVKMALTAPELIVLCLIGVGQWRRLRQHDFAAWTVVMVVGAIFASAKVGSDVNYFICWRIPAALAVAAMATSPAASWQLLILSGAMVYSTASHVNVLAKAERDHQLLQLRFAEPLAASIEQAKRLAADPNQLVLTDVGLLALEQRNRAAFADPWLFRQLVLLGKIDPTPLQASLARERYAALILSADLNAPGFDALPFSLPPPISTTARQHYRFVGQLGPWFVYRPRTGD